MFDRITLPVMGTLVNDPESRVIPNTDQEIVSFRLAVDNGYWDRDKKEEVKTGTTFFTVSCKRSLAQNVLASEYKPGTRLIVVGELTTKNYTTKEGAERTDVKIAATDVGPSNLWTPVRVPPREGRGGGRQAERPAPQSGGYGSFQGGGDDWQPAYRQGGGQRDQWATAQPGGGEDPWQN